MLIMWLNIPDSVELRGKQVGLENGSGESGSFNQLEILKIHYVCSVLMLERRV